MSKSYFEDLFDEETKQFAVSSDFVYKSVQDFLNFNISIEDMSDMSSGGKTYFFSHEDHDNESSQFHLEHFLLPVSYFISEYKGARIDSVHLRHLLQGWIVTVSQLEKNVEKIEFSEPD